MMKRVLGFTSSVILTTVLTSSASCLAFNRAYNSEKPSREEEIRNLLAIVSDGKLRETEPDQVIVAVQRLGELKASAAVPDLVAILTFKRLYPWDKDPTLPRDETEMVTSRRRFPAISALAQIGRPALPALTKVIESSDVDSLESQCALETIRNVFLDDRMVGVRYLEQAAEKALSPEGVRRLLEAAGRLRNIDGYKAPL